MMVIDTHLARDASNGGANFMPFILLGSATRGPGAIAFCVSAADPSGQGAKSLRQWAELVVDDVEDEIGIHPEVLVDDDVAQPCDRSPRTTGMASRVSGGRARTASPMTPRLRSTASYAIDPNSSERRYRS